MPARRMLTVVALALLAAVVLLATVSNARPTMKPDRPKTEPSKPAAEQTCGQELAAAAEVPQKWGALMEHVASNMEWHAGWVGAGSPAAKREHDALLRVATEYKAMAAAGARAAMAMMAMKGLEPVPHDRTKLDRGAQARWMRAKIKMQREFSTLLLQHAEESEKALAELEGAGERER